MFHLYTLGRIALVHTEDPDRPLLAEAKPLAVLAVLAVEGPKRAEQVAELVWPEAPKDRADASLRQALYRLSKVAGVPLVRRSAAALDLDADHLTTDIAAFRVALGDRDWTTAIDLCRGHFLGGYETGRDRRFVQWAEGVDDWVRVNLEGAFVEAVEEAMRAGNTGAALTLARDFAARFRLHPPAAHALALALRGAGDASGALTELRLFEQRLRQEADEALPENLTVLLRELDGELRVGLVEAGEAAANGRGHGRGTTRRRALVAAGLVSVAMVTALGLGLANNAARLEPLVIPAFTAQGAARVTLSAAGLALEQVRTDAWPEVRSPDGWRALGVITPGGVDTDLVLPDGTRRRILSAPADEVPVDWSPDGRYLLILETHLLPHPPGYHKRLDVWDRETGESRVLFDYPVEDAAGRGVWSPDGARIALDVELGEEPRALVVIDTTGRVLSRIGDDDLKPSSPAWSPDGERLAFTGSRGGDVDVYVADWTGRHLRRLAATTASEQTPVWLSNEHVVALTFGPDPRLVIRSIRRPEAVSLPLESVRRLPASELDAWPDDAAARVSRLLSAIEVQQQVATAAVWLEKLALQGPPPRVSPGEYVTFRLTGSDPRGRSTTLLPPEATWSTTDSSSVQPLGHGSFRFTTPGEFQVRASVPGWEGDSVVVAVAVPRIRPAPILFQEDWRRPRWMDRWRCFGDPLPAVTDNGGPGGAFDNRGDENLWSGAVSSETFPLADGLTVEVWGRAAFTGEPFQSLEIGITDAAPVLDPVFGPTPSGSVFTVDLSGTTGNVTSNVDPAKVPLPEGMDDWHLYAVQVQPDGTAALLVDGRVHVRYRLQTPLPSSGRVLLAGRSLTTTVLHGPVTVYSGPRYAID